MAEVGKLVIRVTTDTKDVQTGFASVGERVQGFGKRMTDVGKTMSARVTAPLVGIATAAVSVGASFDAQMSRVQAISGATGDDLVSLRDLAKELGATTRFSASEAAQGMEYMALAGWNAQQTMSAMPGLLDLAAAAAVDLGQASDIVTDTMSAYSIEAERATEVADMFAAAQSMSNTSVTQLGEALRMVAPTASSLGISLGDTNAALGLLADQGIKGGQAGTTLNAVLADMVSKAEDGRLEFGEFAVSLYDHEGNFRDLGELIREIEEGIAGMTDEQRANALGAVFQRQSLRGVNALLGEGADRYDELAEAIEDSTGLAAKQAEIMEDNVAGGFTALKSQLEGLAIELSDVLAPTVKDTIIPMLQNFGERIGRLIERFQSMDERTQKWILALVGIVAAIGPVLMVLGPLTTGVGTLWTLLGKGPAIIGAISTALKFLAANPVGAVIAALGLLVIAGVAIYKNWEEISRRAVIIWGGIKDIIGAFIDQLKLNVSRGMESVRMAFYRAIERILDAVEPITRILPGKWKAAFDEMHQAVSDMADKSEARLKELAENTEENADRMRRGLAQLSEGFSRVAEAAGSAAAEEETWLLNTEERMRALQKATRATDEDSDSKDRAAGAAKGAAAATDKLRMAIEGIERTVQIAQAEFDLWSATLGITASESEVLQQETALLTVAMEASAAKVALLEDAYQQMVQAKGAAAEESQKLYLELLKEQKAHADLAAQIAETNRVQQEGDTQARYVMGMSLAEWAEEAARLGMMVDELMRAWGVSPSELEELLPSFDGGGYIPGPPGEPRAIVAHGGELVLTEAQQRELLGGTTIHMAPGSVVIPARDLREMSDVRDFFARIQQVSRQGVVAHG